MRSFVAVMALLALSALIGAAAQPSNQNNASGSSNQSGADAAQTPQQTAVPTTANITDYQSGQLFQYIKSTGTYWCPADDTNSPSSGYPYRVEKMSTYVINGCASGNFRTATANSFKFTRVNPVGVLFWEPNEKPLNTFQTFGSYNDAVCQPEEDATRFQGPSDRHRNGSVLLFNDGHTSFIKTSVALAECLDTLQRPNEFWWSPASPNTGGAPDGNGN